MVVAYIKKTQKDVLSKVNIRNLADITVKIVLNLSNFGKKLSTFVGYCRVVMEYTV